MHWVLRVHWVLALWVLTLDCSVSARLLHVHQYERVVPQRLHSDLPRRGLRGAQNLYPEQARYTLSIGGKNYTLQLLKNRELLVKNYTVTYYLENGTEVTETPDVQDHCYYQGQVEGATDSQVSVSTCDGISGFLQIDGQMYLIEPLPGAREETHALYKHEHLRVKRGTCQDSNSSMVYDYGPKAAAMMKPHTWKPAPLQKGTRYVELYLVVDKAEYNMYQDMATLQHRMKLIINHVDKLYRSLNFRVALIGMEVWTYKDKITVSPDADLTLKNFLSWRKSDLLKRTQHDNAQLITGVNFQDTTVGLATKLAMCTSDSGGVNQDHSVNPIGAASTLAHEMGHNLGMSHDEDIPGCSCAEGRRDVGCVMSKKVGREYPKLFSSCSQSAVQNFVNDLSPSCLINPPDTDQLYGGPVCGNQFVESGEACDCGTLEECTNPCCNATTCQLKEGAECAQGECCQQCKIRPVGDMCRKQKGDCDLPEYCTGSSAQCPEDAFQENGAACGYGSGYCYNGECPTLTWQCKTLWGSGAQVAPNICFTNNVQGSELLHCKKTAQGYRGCRNKDLQCGRLQCVNGKEFPITRKKYIMIMHNKVECKMAQLAEDESERTTDPGMVSPGTKCGMGMVCIEGECQDLTVYGERNCSAKCNNRGVCNHKRECHCDPGWAPPYCNQKFTDIPPGEGSDILIIALLVAVTLFVVLIIGGIVYYKWRQKKYPQKRAAAPGSSSGLSNPLFQDSASKPFIKKDPQNHLIGRPQLIASTSNLQNSRSICITVTPSEDAEQAPSFTSSSHEARPLTVPKSPQVTKPRVPPPALPVPPQAPQKPSPPNKPLPALKTKPKPSPVAPPPPAKPSALRMAPLPTQKVALRPPVLQR